MKKIAFATDDGKTISSHLGRAQYFQVVTMDDADGVSFEQRLKPHHGAEQDVSPMEHAGHGMGQAMIAVIADCQVLIAGGMGEPAYGRALAQGIEVILPAEKGIQAALDAYRRGALVSDTRRVHQH
jgi:predicted Fe-Mo cluster-binding NifX family protein